MGTRLSVLFGLLIALLLFQNCLNTRSQIDVQPLPGDDNHEQRISEITFHKIRYYPMRFTGNEVINTDLKIDLQTGIMSLFISSSTTGTCSLDSNRLHSLRNLLSVARLCSPGALPPGTATCAAIGVPDIDLSNSTTTVTLQPSICHTGLWLCEGKDSILREVLLNIQTSPPASCL